MSESMIPKNTQETDGIRDLWKQKQKELRNKELEVEERTFSDIIQEHIKKHGNMVFFNMTSKMLCTTIGQAADYDFSTKEEGGGYVAIVKLGNDSITVEDVRGVQTTLPISNLSVSNKPLEQTRNIFDNL